MRPKTPESGVLRACLDLLAAERIWHERRNTLPVWVKGKGGKMRPVIVAKPGTADIFATPIVRTKWLHLCGAIINDSNRAPLWIETKSDSGQQSEDQRAFEAEVLAAGHYYVLARSSDDLKRWLIDHGAMRQK